MAGCAALSLPMPAGAAEGVEGITAVASKVSNGLLRDRVPEGNVEVRPPTLIEFMSEPKK
jgi:hypothetical protein